MKQQPYEELFAVWLENRTSEELLKISEDFYAQYSAMLKNLQKSRENALYDTILSILDIASYKAGMMTEASIEECCTSLV